MDGKRICSIMEQKVNSALEKKIRFFPDGSKMSIAYTGFSQQKYQHIFKVTVTGIESTFLDGVGLAMTVMFETFAQFGFIRDGETKAEVLDGGDTYVYTYYLSSEAAENLA